MPDIVTSKTWVDGEKGITAAKMNQIISGAVIQPAFYNAKPSSATLDPTDVLLELKGTGTFAQITGTQLASSVAGQLPVADATQNGMLRQVSGLTTDVVDGTNHCVPAAAMSGITQMRLRSFNMVGNSTFEVDARNGGGVVPYGAGAVSQMQCDRWKIAKNGATAVVNGQRPAYTALPSSPKIQVPGTSFRLSNNCLGLNLATAQGSLAAGDYLTFNHQIEGIRLRELIDDVYSLSLLVYSNVAPLKFAVALRDSGATVSLVKLVTLSSANVWTMISLPNLPLWSGTGSFPTTPGVIGCFLDICLACGTTFTTNTLDVWQSGNFFGAPGMDNFLAKPINTNFYLGFVQCEPGALCTTPLDLDFRSNLDECERYFSKSYDYGVKPGAVQANGSIFFETRASGHPYTFIPFKKRLAKTPTISGYSPTTGAINNVRDTTGNLDRAIAGNATLGEASFSGFTLSTLNAAIAAYQFHYVADTGW